MLDIFKGGILAVPHKCRFYVCQSAVLVAPCFEVKSLMIVPFANRCNAHCCTKLYHKKLDFRLCYWKTETNGIGVAERSPHGTHGNPNLTHKLYLAHKDQRQV